MTVTKDARVNLRLAPADDQLIRRAAKSIGQSVTDFMSQSALHRAHEVLADQRTFDLDDATWEAFVEKLDRPVTADPRLVELFARPQRINR